MKKKLHLLMFVLVIAGTAFTSCKKDKKEDSSDSSLLNKAWKVGDKQYTQLVGMSMSMGNAIAVTAFVAMPSGSATIDRFSVYFKTKPTTNGTYKIVYKPNFADLNADEVYVDAAEAAGDKLAVAKGEGKTATVTVNGGKVSVTVPKVNAYYGTNTGSMEQTTTLEGNIVEQ